MSRYIDADALKLAVIKATTYGDALRAVKEQPSIDIVFCKECKHRGICFGKLVQGIEVVQLNFCSYGEREGE